MWEKLMEWVTQYPLKNGLISPQDVDHIYIAENIDEAMEIIEQAHEKACQKGECVHNNHDYLDK